MNKYDKERIFKHAKGRNEHGDWTEIDPHPEFSDELLDLDNYSRHPDFRFPLIGRITRLFTRVMWTLINK